MTGSREPGPSRRAGAGAETPRTEPVAPSALLASASTDHPGSRGRRLAFFAVTGALAVLILWAFREVLGPFLLAMVVAYVFAPVAAMLERIRVGGQRLPRWIAVVVIYVSLLGAMSGTIAVGAPLLVAEIQKLSREVPRVVRMIRDEWMPELDRAVQSASRSLRSERDAPLTEPVAPSIGPMPEDEEVASIEVVPREGGGFEILLPERGLEVRRTAEDRFVITPAAAPVARAGLSVQLTEAIRSQLQDSERSVATALTAAQTLVAAVVAGIFKFFIMLMLSAYMLMTSRSILGFFRQMVPTGGRSSWDLLIRRVDRGLSGVVRGQLLICVVNGVLSGIGFYWAGLDYWPILTVIATVLSIIPIFGAIISSVPAVLIGLQQGLGVALFVLAWIILIHQIEANLLNPKILGDAAHVHPVLVVFVLLAGEHFFGLTGALLAVPVLSIGQSLFLHFRELALGVPADSLRPSVEPRPPIQPAPPAQTAERAA